MIAPLELAGGEDVGAAALLGDAHGEVIGDLVVFHESGGAEQADGTTLRVMEKSGGPFGGGIVDGFMAGIVLGHELRERGRFGESAGDVAVDLGDAPAIGGPVEVK